MVQILTMYWELLRSDDSRLLKGFPFNCPCSFIVILLPCNPHPLECIQTSQNGATGMGLRYKVGRWSNLHTWVCITHTDTGGVWILVIQTLVVYKGYFNWWWMHSLDTTHPIHVEYNLSCGAVICGGKGQQWFNRGKSEVLKDVCSATGSVT